MVVHRLKAETRARNRPRKAENSFASERCLHYETSTGRTGRELNRTVGAVFCLMSLKIEGQVNVILHVDKEHV